MTLVLVFSLRVGKSVLVIQFDLLESFFYMFCEGYNLWVLNFNRIPVRNFTRFGAVCKQPFRHTSAFDDNLADAS